MADKPILFSKERRWTAAAARIGVDPDEYVAALNRGEKICPGCKMSLPRNNEHSTSGRSRCRPCVSANKKAHYYGSQQKWREKQKLYREQNREKVYAVNAAWQRKRHTALRCEAIEVYGGKCACCGESEPIFLDLDHINNDGSEHRRRLGNGTMIMLSLQRQGWPAGIVQLLCCNCNQGKDRNGGVCPHVR